MSPKNSTKKPKTIFARRLTSIIGEEKNFLFEARCALTNGSVNRYLDGQSPKLEALQSIILATGCNADWLITGRGDAFPKDQ